MARFEGTIQEYHDYIGPRIRNKVNNLTRTARLSKNKICEHCGQKRELQSAHVHGRERRDLIEEVLSKYAENGLVSCDIGKMEDQILEAHRPINITFLFLCQECHKKYDSEGKIILEKQNLKGSKTTINEKAETNRHLQTDMRPKIGKYVQSQFSLFVRKGWLSDLEISNLLDVEYSKNKFDLNFPFLRMICEGILDHNGYNRYYASIFTIGGKEYYLCKEWYDKQQTKVEAWVKKIEDQNSNF